MTNYQRDTARLKGGWMRNSVRILLIVVVGLFLVGAMEKNVTAWNPVDTGKKDDTDKTPGKPPVRETIPTKPDNRYQRLGDCETIDFSTSQGFKFVKDIRDSYDAEYRRIKAEIDLWKQKAEQLPLEEASSREAEEISKKGKELEMTADGLGSNGSAFDRCIYDKVKEYLSRKTATGDYSGEIKIQEKLLLMKMLEMSYQIHVIGYNSPALKFEARDIYLTISDKQKKYQYQQILGE